MVNLANLKETFTPKVGMIVSASLSVFFAVLAFMPFTRSNDNANKVQVTQERDPQEVEFEQNLKKLPDLLSNKFYKESEELCAKMLKVHPHNTQVLSMLALAQHKLGKLDEAEANLRLVIGFEPGEWTFHHNLGNVLFDMGRTADAIDSFQKALDLSKDNPQVLLSQARSLELLGRYTEALNFYTKATEQSIDPSFKVIIKSRIKKLDVLAYIEKGAH